MKESELAEIFIDYFNDGYEVYSEVPAGGGIVDFVATDGTISIGCEVKSTFGLSVLEQAYSRCGSFHYVYICVPYVRTSTNFRERICREWGIGVLTAREVYESWDIHEIVRPKFRRKVYTPDLKEYMKKSVAGSRNNRITAFGHTVQQIERYLRRNGPSHIENILKSIDYHYSTISTAKSSLRKWIRNDVIENINWNSAILSLDEKNTG